eukprot:TRINITY_DN6026_c0_g1_i2.p1 TRINITY_DN6026_c0_g1~~TRINITY_DN6026_c0_g1_i2.p1  ORF type:complete len:167 (+),score=29.62 TRINITY_DN6026_c0_g1_i2:64-564(+)
MCIRDRSTWVSSNGRILRKLKKKLNPLAAQDQETVGSPHEEAKEYYFRGSPFPKQKGSLKPLNIVFSYRNMDVESNHSQVPFALKEGTNSRKESKPHLLESKPKSPTQIIELHLEATCMKDDSPQNKFNGWKQKMSTRSIRIAQKYFYKSPRGPRVKMPEEENLKI